MTATSLNSKIRKTARAEGLNPDLVMAICAVESGFDTYAVRYERSWKWLLNPVEWARRVQTSGDTERLLQSCSWGLMQVMGTVAREHGFAHDFPRLCLPEAGLLYGCMHLKKFLKKYPLPEALGAYNAGPGNRNGKMGQAYAKKVLTQMEKYKRI